MIIPKVEIQNSPTHGRGVYACEDIARGTVIWSMTAIAGREGQEKAVLGCTPRDNRLFSEAEMQHLAGTLSRSEFQQILWGGYPIVPHNIFAELRDGAQFWNHASPANCGGPWSDTPEADQTVALRDIQAGEELTDHYGTYHHEKMPWLAVLMADFALDRFIFEASIEPTEAQTRAPNT